MLLSGFISSSLSLLHLSGAGGMRAAIRSWHVVSPAPSFSEGGRISTLFPCSSTESLPWQIVLHELILRGSFQQASVLPELFKCRSLPWVAVLQEKAATAWDPMG